MEGRKQPPQGEELARKQRSDAGRKGGRASASKQKRDRFGQFAGGAGLGKGKQQAKDRGKQETQDGGAS